jgi:acetyl-CoA carboxylase biotin carboxyl carrier protein
LELKGLRREIAGLAKIMNVHDIEEIEVAADGVSLRLKRQGAQVRPLPGAEAAQHATPFRETDASAEEKRQAGAESTVNENRITIPAPMVGTFYRAPAPDAKPYVEVGDVVSPGQVLCIIEAMKVMNEIQAEVRGKILEILVENAEPVQYGQPLFLLEAL